MKALVAVAYPELVLQGKDAQRKVRMPVAGRRQWSEPAAIELVEPAAKR